MIIAACTVLLALSISSGQAPLEPLPEWFNPLEWDTDVEQARTEFSAAAIQYTQSPATHGELGRAWIVIDGVKRPIFGAAVMTVEQEPRGTTKVVRLETSDDRPECRDGREDGATSRRSPCRWSDLRALRGVLDALRTEVTARFGPPGRTSARGREAQYEWTRRGYVLSLVMEQVESGEWSVAIVAVRTP